MYIVEKEYGLSIQDTKLVHAQQTTVSHKKAKADPISSFIAVLTFHHFKVTVRS